MEEILASIRRIIADDDTAKVQPPKAAEPVVQSSEPAPRSAEPPQRMAWPTIEPEQPSGPPVHEPEDFPQPASFAPEPEPVHEAPTDILDLADQMAVEPPRAASFRGVDVPDMDVVFAERPPVPRPQPASAPMAAEPPAAPPSHPAYEHRDPQPSRGDQAPVRSEPNLMSATTSAAVDSAFNALAQTVLVQNGRTLEDLVREMLRPMLKSWLDDNLPGLVERLVRAEIERVSRGRP